MIKKELNPGTTSGANRSSWSSEQPADQFPVLTEPQETDVVIVGAGIAGLSVAYQLLKSGKRVIVVEDGLPGSGETGRTSAHLTVMLDRNYTEYEQKLGAENTRLLAESHSAGIDFIERVSLEENIDCDFLRVDGYLFIHPSDTETDLYKEAEAAQKAGLRASVIEVVPGMLKEVAGVKFANQAQFHPLKYITGLCAAIRKMGGVIFTHTHAKEISGEGIVASNGIEVKAAHVVVATNAPVNNKFVMSFRQIPHRTYMIGAKIPKGRLIPSLWNDTGDFYRNSDMPPYHYIRLQELDEEYDLLLCGGEDHLTGDVEKTEPPMKEEDRYAAIEEWAREHFPMDEVIFRWSGQVMQSTDGVAYIGRNQFDKNNVYVVTGDTGDGLTSGSIAGMLITDLINDVKNPWEDLFKVSRHTLKGAITGAAEIIGSVFTPNKSAPGEDALSTLLPGDGKIVEIDGQKCGAYRDKDGSLEIVSAKCTHMGCIVAWNNDEKSWDCPCHGSRFATSGKVMHGPANIDLPSVKQSK